MGTPDAALAREIPSAINEMVPTMLNMNTTRAMEMLLLNFVLRSTKDTTESK